MAETQIERIYKFIRASDTPVTPKEISDSLNIKRKNVRARIAELRQDGKIARRFHGHFHYKYIVSQSTTSPGQSQDIGLLLYT